VTIDPSIRHRRLFGIIGAAALTALLVPTTADARPSQTACERHNNSRYEKLLECVTAAGVKEHLAAFQAIADANGDTRAEQTPGYEASVDYVEATMLAAGWEVQRVPFEYQAETDAALQQLTLVQADYETGGYTGSAGGNVTGDVVAVDINTTGDRVSTSGCDGELREAAVGAPLVADPAGPDDFETFPAGSIALIQRGGCSFALKAYNALAAGATAVIIFNQGNSPDREPLFIGSASAPDGSAVPGPLTIPVVGASFAAGVALAAPGSTARVFVELTTFTAENVIAEKEGINDDNVVMAGAHLDSVPAGPGINDNGSGSAALLEIGQNLANHRPVNTLRFAWWGAEELGLIGSTAWVNQQDEAGTLDEVALYLNFDMIGSPNYYIGVYDADESSYAAPVPVPEGSTAIEDVFESFYTLVGEPYDDTEFSGRSDYQAFINHEIPSSGLFTGAEVPKTAEQVGVWGGTAGQQFDPCYHKDCDTFLNINDHALDVNTDAIAFAVLTFAYSTESVNGVPGRRVPGSRGLPTPAGPAGTCPGQPTTTCKL
jgi:Zn-dependent M28 family amino/carboxypeptidase